MKSRVTTTKRSRPLAKVRAVKKKAWKSPEGILRGKVRIVGDIVNADTSDLWNCLRED